MQWDTTFWLGGVIESVAAKNKTKLNKKVFTHYFHRHFNCPFNPSTFNKPGFIKWKLYCFQEVTNSLEKLRVIGSFQEGIRIKKTKVNYLYSGNFSWLFPYCVGSRGQRIDEVHIGVVLLCSSLQCNSVLCITGCCAPW